ncbi:MAG: acetyl-CoA carboxylase biotin carboxyl carrier protein subunit, partial [Wenzhouxiangella sp.]
VLALGASRVRLGLEDRSRPVWLHADDESRLDVCLDQRRWTLTRHARFEAARSSAGGDGRILAPMPGKILEIRVTEGAQVAEGEAVVVMEAMKMELTIKAPINGVVEALAVERGDLVEADAVLLSLIASDTAD